MIDRMLLAKEMNVVHFGESLKEHDLLTALTPVSANAQHDYERLELLGTLIFISRVPSIY